jgi:ATP-binding cassette subfamily C protein CydC
MAAGTLLGWLAQAAAVGLLTLAGWFIAATALAGLTPLSAQLFNFFYPSIGVRLFAVARTGCRYLERLVCHDATFRLLEDLRRWFYSRLEPLMPGRLAAYRSADILNRIVGDIDALDHLYLRALSPLVIAAFTAMALAFFLGRFSHQAALAALLFLAAGGLLLPLAAGRMGAAAGRAVNAHAARLRVRIVEGLQGLGDLLLYDANRRHLERLRRDDLSLIDAQRRMARVRGFSAAAMTLLSGGAVLSVVYIGATLAYRGTLPGVHLAMLGLAVLASFEAVAALPQAFQWLGHTREAARRLLEIVQHRPEVRFPTRSAGSPSGFDVRFEGVRFRYRGALQQALDGIDLHVAAGQRVAIVGASGAGKSTLFHLLTRFWDPDEGCLRIGGRDIRTLSEADLRRYLAVVSQQAHIFSRSIRQNLLMAKPEASERELNSALRSAQLQELVDQLPDGLDTWVGETGKLLSGGEARRLVIARAILRDAPIWLLDEPTEGLDQHTARELMCVLRRLTKDRTVLLVTHRLVDLQAMDVVTVIERGRIVEAGPLGTLMTAGGRLSRLQPF